MLFLLYNLHLLEFSLDVLLLSYALHLAVEVILNFLNYLDWFFYVLPLLGKKKK